MIGQNTKVSLPGLKQMGMIVNNVEKTAAFMERVLG